MAADEQFRVFHRHSAVRRDRMREPDVAADDAVVADARIAAKNRRSRIDGDVIFDVGMPLVGMSADQLATGITTAGGIERAESDAVIESDVFPDRCRLADYHAGAVIDEE